jgi:hypothetical protein
MRHSAPIRVAALVLATVIVGGGVFGLGSYSNTKNAAAVAAAVGAQPADATHTAIAPLRIDVVGKRAVRGAA